MTVQVEVTFDENHELILSLMAFANKKFHKGLEIGPSWIKQVKAELSREFITRLHNIAMEDFVAMTLFVLKHSPVKNDLAGYTLWLSQLTRGDLYELIVPYVSEGNNVPKNIEQRRDQFIDIIKEWNKAYFSKIDRRIIEGLKKEALERKESLSNNSSLHVVEKATNGLVFEEEANITNILLVPQYHFRPINLIEGSNEQFLLLAYPTDPVPAEEGFPSAALLRLTKALSDENRLRILKFLDAGQKSFTQIVDYIGLAKSTVSHHMVTLRSAGLVRVHIFGTSGDKYSVREDTLNQLSARLVSFIKGV